MVVKRLLERVVGDVSDPFKYISVNYEQMHLTANIKHKINYQQHYILREER